MDLAVRAINLEILVVIRVSFLKFFPRHVPLGNWVAVGARFPPGPLNREGKRWDSMDGKAVKRLGILEEPRLQRSTETV